MATGMGSCMVGNNGYDKKSFHTSNSTIISGNTGTWNVTDKFPLAIKVTGAIYEGVSGNNDKTVRAYAGSELLASCSIGWNNGSKFPRGDAMALTPEQALRCTRVTLTNSGSNNIGANVILMAYMDADKKGGV